jgi:hypothetical protein
MDSAFLINIAFLPLGFYLTSDSFQRSTVKYVYPAFAMIIAIGILVRWMPDIPGIYAEDGDISIFFIIPLSLSYGFIAGVLYSFSKLKN